MNNGNNAYVKQPKVFVETVWFAGNTAISEGQGLCYNSDYGTATSADGRRANYVEVPTITNNMNFAGVAARDYPAAAYGQFIEIYNPGSTCNVLTNVDTVVNTGIITCIAGGGDAGDFYTGGFAGRGSAVPLQTVTAGTGSVCLAYLQTGGESGLVQVVTPPTTGATFDVMQGGVTRFIGTVTIGTGNHVGTLATPSILGLRKGFVCTGTYTTNDVQITLAAAGKQAAVSTSTGVPVALASISFDANGETAVLEWDGVWKEINISGATPAAS